MSIIYRYETSKLSNVFAKFTISFVLDYIFLASICLFLIILKRGWTYINIPLTDHLPFMSLAEIYLFSKPPRVWPSFLFKTLTPQSIWGVYLSFFH